MPHSTESYPFEGKVFAFVNQLSMQMMGGHGDHGFVIRFADDGTARSVSLEPPTQGWPKFAKELENEDARFLLYDPFDPPEYAWVSWRGVPRATMERLLGAPLEPADFERSEYAGSRQNEMSTPGVWPEVWSVMF